MMARALVSVAGVLLLATVLATGASSRSMPEKPAVDQPEKAQPSDKGLAKATFAGGCFWCMEGPFDELDGVVSTTSGYTGGRTRNPTYEDVSAGGTGHAEAVEIVYDPAKISYERLLEVFWRNVDPLDNGGQFCDRGSQYRTAIFVHNAEQRAAAEKSKAALRASGRLKGTIVTEIVDRGAFYRAEEYHQDYYQRNPLRYRYYRFSCGRDRRLKALWGEAATH